MSRGSKSTFMQLQRLHQFLLEADPGVMRLLVQDIRCHRSHHRLADREAGVPHLPGELGVSVRLFMHPFRRGGLQSPDQLRQARVRLEAQEEMNMIGHAAEYEDCTPLPADDASHEGIELRAQSLCNERPAVLGAEYDVDQDFHE